MTKLVFWAATCPPLHRPPFNVCLCRPAKDVARWARSIPRRLIQEIARKMAFPQPADGALVESELTVLIPFFCRSIVLKVAKQKAYFFLSLQPSIG